MFSPHQESGRESTKIQSKIMKDVMPDNKHIDNTLIIHFAPAATSSSTAYRHVSPKIHSGGAPVVTMRTCEGLFAGVNAHVHFQIHGKPEILPADFAFERPLASVGPHVNSQ